ncbi:MAG: hypothetical protein WCC21_04505 [Candidatus Acidiferrales bacterium]
MSGSRPEFGEEAFIAPLFEEQSDIVPGMKRQKDGPIRLNMRQRVFLAVAGLIVLLPGLMALLRGGGGYVDYRGLIAFAPAMVLVGVLMIAIAIFKGKSVQTK